MTAFLSLFANSSTPLWMLGLLWVSLCVYVDFHWTSSGDWSLRMGLAAPWRRNKLLETPSDGASLEGPASSDPERGSRLLPRGHEEKERPPPSRAGQVSPG